MNRRERQAPGTVELRLSGSPEDTGTVISVLERLAAGLPVTTVGLEILHRAGLRANRAAIPGSASACSSGSARTEADRER